MSEVLEAALLYAAQGWRVIRVNGLDPVTGACGCFAGARCTMPAKHPVGKNWTELASSDPATVRGWFKRGSPFNVGIATGAASGVFVLDVDVKNDGVQTLAALEERHGPLPVTPTEVTGGGGRHHLFRHVEGLGNSAGRLGAGLDTRGDGGQIVASPSRHTSGRRYAWLEGMAPGDVSVAEAPTWMVDALLRRAAVKVRTTAPEKATDATDDVPARRNRRLEADVRWERMYLAGASSGGRNVVMSQFAGYLFRRGLSGYMVLDLCQAWNATRFDPPMGADEVEKTVDSIAKKELQRLTRTR